MKLSRLEKVDLREVWKHEATDFTIWLSKKENLDLLSEEIDISISLIQTEASVGKFNVDILAEEENSGKKIIIENQLETTDHDHLGKVITYASGYDAEILIWIVRSVRDEHKQAVDWLNEHTSDKVNIFLIQMEAWRIEGSPVAPKFNIIAEPNDWAKAVKTIVPNTELSDLKIQQLEFWTKFKEYSKENNAPIKLRKAYPQHWYDISFGSSEAHIALTINTLTNQFGVEIYIPNSKDLFKKLEVNKTHIQSELGAELEWLELPEKKASRIKYFTNGDLSSTDKWDTYFNWLLENTLKFQSVFSKYI